MMGGFFFYGIWLTFSFPFPDCCCLLQLTSALSSWVSILGGLPFFFFGLFFFFSTFVHPSSPGGVDVWRVESCAAYRAKLGAVKGSDPSKHGQDRAWCPKP